MLLPPRSTAHLWAFDFGTRTGWAVNHPELGIRSGVARLAETPRGKRANDLRRLFDDLRAQFGPPDALYHEYSSFMGGKAHNQVLSCMDRGALYFVLEAWSWAHRPALEPRHVSPSQAKKALTGMGNADKVAHMIPAASRVAGEAIADPNQADAIAVLLFAMDDWRTSRLGKEEGRPEGRPVVTGS